MSNARVGVIGSGFGGLATAIRLQASGFDVTILEKRDLPGGRAYVYHDQGFTFDAGPTVVTAPNSLEELFALGGKSIDDYVDLISVSPLYRLHWEDGYTFDYTNDMEATLAQIAKKSPEDAARYPEFLRYTEEVFEAGYTKLAHVPFLDWGSMIRVAPQLFKLKAYRSVYSMVSKYIQDPQLRQAFSFHSLLVGGNPFSASSIYTLIHFLERKWGVFFPKGGTHALVRALVKLFEDLGGKIQYHAEVAEIRTKDGRVTGVSLLDGRTENFDAVVSNADVARTYLDLLKRESRLEGVRARMAKARYSMSLFLVYFGVNRRYPDIAHHNVIFGHRYRELLKDIFSNGVLADDFSLYLHAPSKTDPSMAPEGCEAFYALSPVPHLGNCPLDWKTEGPKYAEKILSYLEKRYLPGLRSHIVTQRIFTPEDFGTYLNAHLGSAFSLEPVLTQSAYFRVHNRDERVRGLYFAGAGTHPGAGIPGVVNSAKATASLVVEDFLSIPIELTSPSQSVVSDPVAAALSECRNMIEVGSKSFSMAAKLFRPEIRDAAFFLYGWCRYCDDQIDGTMNLRVQEGRVETLREQTQSAFHGKPVDNSVFVALSHLARTYRIPSHYALELIEGMAMDVRKDRYWTLEDLSLYCYRVAGTVGLMMSHVMGVSDDRALTHAAHMGMAMQLTNIARDVVEDAVRERVYLPLNWLDEAGISERQVAQVKYRQTVADVVERLLEEASTYYESGEAGLRFLPWRAALAVAVASSVYSAIGKKVLKRGALAWDTRTVVSKWEKMVAVLRGLGLVLLTVPYRLIRPWRPVQLRWVWKLQT